MADLRNIPLPRTPSGQMNWEDFGVYMGVLVREVLSKADIRAALGNGITISTVGNSVATISVDINETDIPAEITRDTELTAAIDAHEAAADPHPGYPTTAGTETITGAWTFEGTAPYLGWHETDGTANKRRYRATVTGSKFEIGVYDDAEAATSSVPFRFDPSAANYSGGSSGLLTLGAASTPIHAVAITAGATATDPVFVLDSSSGCSVFTGLPLVAWAENFLLQANYIGLQHDGTTGYILCTTTVDVQATGLTLNAVAVATRSTGTYTGTLTGCTTSPTGTLRYTRTGQTVSLLIPAISATSNTTAATITGMPAAIRPARTQTLLMRVVDNGTTQLGMVEIATSGVMTLYVGAAAAAFTNSGTKGVAAVTITYPLD